MSELLLGCGFRRDKLMGPPGAPLVWKNLVTCDQNIACNPDVMCNLDAETWDAVFTKESQFDEVHAYEVLEHLGQQGYAKTFFSTFANIHRILKPNGYLFATVPSRFSPWLWGDPSHRRVILQESLIFLSQDEIRKRQIHGTPMSDFSALWTRDFRIVASTDNHQFHMFCLQAIK
jgi:SAM-dependent methyltransferase